MLLQLMHLGQQLKNFKKKMNVIIYVLSVMILFAHQQYLQVNMTIVIVVFQYMQLMKNRKKKLLLMFIKY